MSKTDRTLAQAYAIAAEAHPDARLIVSSARRPAELALADLVRQGRIVGENLRARGIGQGDIVAVQLPGWAEWLMLAVGIAHVGAVILPIVSIYGAKEVGFILRQSGAKLIVTPDRWRSSEYRRIIAECGPLPMLAGHVVIGEETEDTVAWTSLTEPCAVGSPAPGDPDAPALLVYTSGTTADPKGVMHTARTLLSEIAQVNASRRPIERDVGLSPWPPGHVAGALSLLRHLIEGQPLVLMDQWDGAEAARLIEMHRVTSCSFTPFTLSGMIEAADRAGRDISSLVSCMVGAAPVPPSLIDRCSELGLRTFRCYGSSEHPTVTVGQPEDPLDKRLTTEGRPMAGIELRFVDDEGQDVPAGRSGEIATRGPDRFIGYTDPAIDAKAFLSGGWYLTGDVGRLDDDGYLLITDRKKDIIIRGGENISSREVEDLLFGAPGIAEAAVVAAPDVRMGEVVCAFVIVRAGATVTLETVRSHFAQAGVARQKTPERLVVVADFPRTATGKILKHSLRAALRDGHIEGMTE